MPRHVKPAQIRIAFAAAEPWLALATHQRELGRSAAVSSMMSCEAGNVRAAEREELREVV